jgi:hypothetical protein
MMKIRKSRLFYIYFNKQMLLIIYLNDKRFASKLLCLLCIEEKIKYEITNLDGIQILLR